MRGQLAARAVDASDPPRLIGALIDFLVTVLVVAAGVTALLGYGDQGRVVTVFEIAAVVVIALCLDLALYVLPVAAWGVSLGNALTGRRVLDAETGDTLMLRRAVRRYFARRNVWRWHTARDRHRPVGAGDPPTRSWADRVVRSVVVRS